MEIIVRQIDTTSIQLIGAARLPSYLIHFSSPMFSGIARFVPASDVPVGCEGQKFEVEIAQDAVTEFQLPERQMDARIDQLDSAGSFRVHGVVTNVLALTESPVSRWTIVTAGDATFTLTPEDTFEQVLQIGAHVSFVAHCLSFWDEAI